MSGMGFRVKLFHVTSTSERILNKIYRRMTFLHTIIATVVTWYCGLPTQLSVCTSLWFPQHGVRKSWVIIYSDPVSRIVRPIIICT